MTRDTPSWRGFSGERLTVARQRRGLTKASLASLISRAARTVGDYEAGKSEPSARTIQKLADVLRFPVDFFYRPLDRTMPLNAASFRSLSKMSMKQANAALAVGTLAIELNDWIEARFDLPAVDIPDLEPGLLDPCAAAALVRSSWGLGHLPIANMLHLLELHGVRVFSLADECREVDAFSAWVDGTPYVCVATYKTPERAIFDAAHELGHLVLHRDHASPRGRREEVEANDFASCLLMPSEDLEPVAPHNPNLQDLIAMKRRWRVSVAALNYRLHRLGFTSDWHYRELCMDIGQLGRDKEPDSVPREFSQLLAKVFRSMQDEGVSPSAIAHDLAIPDDELDAISFGLPVRILRGAGETTPPVKGHLRLV